MIALEQNSKLGAYYVGTFARPIHNKLQALELAQKTGAKVRWEFNDLAYSQINWQHEPEVNIDMLYLMRARQLRDKYDHLVLNFSGGSDSTKGPEESCMNLSAPSDKAKYSSDTDSEPVP